MINTRTISSIIIPDYRIRSNITDNSVRELADDIEKNGLFHPIVVRKIDTQNEQGITISKFFLVAGERRLTAIKLLFKEGKSFKCSTATYKAKEGIIPFTFIGDLPESTAVEIELNENLMREDLDWKTVVSARARLHELRTKEAEEQDKKWTIQETATELAKTSQLNQSYAVEAIKKAEVIAPYLKDKDLKNIKTEREAYNLVLKKIEGEFLASLQDQEVKKDSVNTDKANKSKKSKHKLILGDLTEVSLPENAFSLIVTDPPYGINADKFGSNAQFTHSYNDSAEFALSIAGDIFRLGYNWSKENAHLFMFCDISLFEKLKTYAEQYNWKPFRTPIIAHHPQYGHIPWGPNNFQRRYDCILYAKKGIVSLSRTTSDVINISREANDSGHGAAKPISLYGDLIELTTFPGDYVLDPCCGSGTVFAAAERLGRIGYGIEINEDIYKTTLTRLMELEKGLTESKEVKTKVKTEIKNEEANLDEYL